MVDGIATPLIPLASSCDANHKGNRRAKVMPGLSAGFHCSPCNLSAESQCRCPYVGSRFWAVGGSFNSAAPRAGGLQLDQQL